MLRNPNDTIVARSTPPGGSPRCIVRLSGPGAFGIAAKCAREALLQRPHACRMACSFRFPREELSGENNWETDGGLYLMRAPATYTRQDVVEFHLPGSPALCEAAMRGCVALGARLAEPGEFTLRAFLNGRLDLCQAEGVESLIRASSDGERRAALSQLEGELSGRVRKWRDRLVTVAGEIEARLDFEEDETGPHERTSLLARLNSVGDALDRTLEAACVRLAPQGRIPVHFVGLTNAGKSSLINALLERDAAVVASERSTTRDALCFEFDSGSFHFTLQDNPGLDDSEDTLSRLANRQAKRAGESAGIVVLVADATEAAPIALAPLLDGLENVPVLLAWNKCDLPVRTPHASPAGHDFAGEIRLSARTGMGLQDLREELCRLACEDTHAAAGRERYSQRTIDALRRARKALDRCRSVVEDDAYAELAAEELREAFMALGHILGEGYAEEVLERIFSDFCIGK